VIEVPVRIQRDGVWQTIGLHDLSDEELEAFAKEWADRPMEGWKWARDLARKLAYPSPEPINP
jgi:hypothetical protein